MKRIIEWDDDVVYVGFYKGVPYCISERKKFVEKYMSIHRKCENYEICEYDCDSLFITVRSELYLYEYNDLYVTERDIIMCRLFRDDVADTIVKTYNNLVELSKLVGQTKKGKKMMKDLISSLNVLTKIANDEDLVEDLQAISELDNPFIYSSIDEYRSYVSRYEDYLNSKENWDRWG